MLEAIDTMLRAPRNNAMTEGLRRSCDRLVRRLTNNSAWSTGWQRRPFGQSPTLENVGEFRCGSRRFFPVGGRNGLWLRAQIQCTHARRA